jgi:hypothetical protein
MIIQYEMRGRTPHNKPTDWVEFAGEFTSWEAFEQFKRRELQMSLREVRNAKDLQKLK